MKRLVAVLSLTIGLFALSTSSASAYYCGFDPNIGVGTPINYSITTNTRILGITLWTENSGSSYQHFAGGLGVS